MRCRRARSTLRRDSPATGRRAAEGEQSSAVVADVEVVEHLPDGSAVFEGDGAGRAGLVAQESAVGKNGGAVGRRHRARAIHADGDVAADDQR